MRRTDRSPDDLIDDASVRIPKRAAPTVSSMHGPHDRPVTRARPAGWSPGTIALVAAWLGAGAIARLTGAPVVIALMVVLLVGVGVDAITGWLAVRRLVVHGVVGPDVVDVGAETPVAIALETSPDHRVRRIVVVDPATGEPVGSGDDTTCGRIGRSRAECSDTIATVTIICRFGRAGVLDRLRIDVEAVGALGLLWWRRPTTIPTGPIHVAPLAAGPLLDVDRSPATLDGPDETRRGLHHGDVDGVRPWRDGEPAVAVHWPSSLRSRSLIVHDRSASSEHRWTVDVSALPDGAGARLRMTIDEGLRRGHRVAVVRASGASSDVTTGDGAARRAAEVEAAETMRDGIVGDDDLSIWRRPLRMPRRAVEPMVA